MLTTLAATREGGFAGVACDSSSGVVGSVMSGYYDRCGLPATRRANSTSIDPPPRPHNWMASRSTDDLVERSCPRRGRYERSRANESGVSLYFSICYICIAVNNWAHELIVVSTSHIASVLAKHSSQLARGGSSTQRYPARFILLSDNADGDHPRQVRGNVGKHPISRVNWSI